MCAGQQVVYAWARNAPELDLPEGVGFRVGGPDSEIDWLVLQVSHGSLPVQQGRRNLGAQGHVPPPPIF